MELEEISLLQELLLNKSEWAIDLIYIPQNHIKGVLLKMLVRMWYVEPEDKEYLNLCSDLRTADSLSVDQ